MSLEYVDGSASLDPLYQRLMGYKREQFEDLEEIYHDFRRSLGGVDIHRQDLSAILDGYILQATNDIRDIHNAFVDLINVTDIPPRVLERIILSAFAFYRSLLRIFRFIDRIDDVDGLDWNILEIVENLLKKIIRENPASRIAIQIRASRASRASRSLKRKRSVKK